jgi:hypothetical protein
VVKCAGDEAAWCACIIPDSRHQMLFSSRSILCLLIKHFVRNFHTLDEAFPLWLATALLNRSFNGGPVQSGIATSSPAFRPPNIALEQLTPATEGKRKG